MSQSKPIWALRNVPQEAEEVRALIQGTRETPYDCVNSPEERKRFQAFLKWASAGCSRRDFLCSLISWLIDKIDKKVLKDDEEVFKKELKSKQAHETNKRKRKQRKLDHLLGPDGSPVVSVPLQRADKLSPEGNPSQIYKVLKWFLDNHPDSLTSTTLASYWQYYDQKKTTRKKTKSATKTRCPLPEQLEQCSSSSSKKRKVSDGGKVTMSITYILN